MQRIPRRELQLNVQSAYTEGNRVILVWKDGLVVYDTYSRCPFSGKGHRLNGPNFVHANGTLEYAEDGSAHRCGGPSYYQPAYSTCKYYYRGKHLPPEQFHKAVFGEV